MSNEASPDQPPANDEVVEEISQSRKSCWFLSIWEKCLPKRGNDAVDAGETAMTGGINAKKTAASGLMDFAFLTANANQLNQAINNKNQTLIIVLISISIGLQILTGVLLICTSYVQLEKQKNATLIDHLTVALVFFIAVVNVFIAAFSSN